MQHRSFWKFGVSFILHRKFPIDFILYLCQFENAQMSWTRIFLYIGCIIVIIYCIVAEGSYKEIDYGLGSSVLNVEGTASADLSASNMATMVFDNYDIRLPEQEKNAIFIATHIIGYKQQERNSVNNEQSKCIDIATKCPCKAGEFTMNGVATGGCINSKCEINGWCTSDTNTDDSADNIQQKYDALLDGVAQMLVTFQIIVEFPIFGVTKIVNLKERKQGYNVWRIGDILKGINEKYENIREKGLIIVINMHWMPNIYGAFLANLERNSFSRLSMTICPRTIYKAQVKVLLIVRNDIAMVGPN